MTQTRGILEIIVNGLTEETAARTLAELLEERGVAAEPVATALNGGFVSRGRRANTPLSAGDRVEIVSPRQGG